MECVVCLLLAYNFEVRPEPRTECGTTLVFQRLDISVSGCVHSSHAQGVLRDV